jgi:hypothetical protein
MSQNPVLLKEMTSNPIPIPIPRTVARSTRRNASTHSMNFSRSGFLSDLVKDSLKNKYTTDFINEYRVENKYILESDGVLSEDQSQSLISTHRHEMMLDETISKIPIQLSDDVKNALRVNLIPHLMQTFCTKNFIPMGSKNRGQWKLSEEKTFECGVEFHQYNVLNYGSDPIESHAKILSNNKRSIVETLIFLNDDYDGGNLIFYNKENKRVLNTPPKTGSVVTFNQTIKHSHDSSLNNYKYVLSINWIFTRKKRFPTGRRTEYVYPQDVIKQIDSTNDLALKEKILLAYDLKFV